MKKEKNCLREVYNRTDEDLPLYDKNGVHYLTVPAHSKTYNKTEKQVQQSRDFYRRYIPEGEFTKVYKRKFMELYEELKGKYTVNKANAIVASVNVLISYLKYDMNILLIKDDNGKKCKDDKGMRKFTAIDLANIMGVERQTASNYMKAMKEAKILATANIKPYGKVFAMNPNIHICGTSVPENIINLFREYKGV